MRTMTATVGHVTAEQIGEVRGWADEALELAGPGDGYMATRVSAVRATLDWVEGSARVSPVGGVVLEPSVPNMEAESRRAVDAESELRRRRERGTYPGVVGETLAWVLGRAEAPL